MYWIAQLVGWIAYSSLIFLATYENDNSKINGFFLLNISSLIVCGIFCTHLMRGFFFRFNWLDLKLTALIPRILLASSICSATISASTIGLSILLDHREKDSLTFLTFMINIFAVLVLILFWNSIYFTYHYFQKLRQQEMDNISLDAKKTEIELKNLRSQLNPHFLFNLLNSIRALVDIDPEQAKNAITHLSILLRKSLILGKENLIPLQEELEMVSNYLDLEKIRFEERLQVLLIHDEQLNYFLIPPFSLQLLVENAIKHGIAHLVNGGKITIETKKADNLVLISVSNTGKINTKRSQSGIGLENMKKRLEIQFKGMADFQLHEDEDTVRALLLFNQKSN